MGLLIVALCLLFPSITAVVWFKSAIDYENLNAKNEKTPLSEIELQKMSKCQKSANILKSILPIASCVGFFGFTGFFLNLY